MAASYPLCIIVIEMSGLLRSGRWKMYAGLAASKPLCIKVIETSWLLRSGRSKMYAGLAASKPLCIKVVRDVLVVGQAVSRLPYHPCRDERM